MNEYQFIMTINGALTVLGIAYVTLIFKKLESHVFGTRIYSFCISIRLTFSPP